VLSYRHAFHAGGPADVLKHAVWAFTLRHLTGKPGSLLVVDSHAGAGGYDLTTPMAEKTGEHRQGVQRLAAAAGPWPALLEPWRGVVGAANPDGRIVSYPGSPGIAARLLRPGDRLELIELHPTDHATLERRFGGRPGIAVTRADGLAAMVALLPPAERRAALLVDPSYEVKDEYESVPEAVVATLRAFRSAVVVLWYPVIERVRSEALLARLAGSGVPRQLRLELRLTPDGAARGMTGFGLVVVNPPGPLAGAAALALPWLADALAATGGTTVTWLVPE
jgi:23S rRNA (adenine2030-N6)-methyltransferase